MGIKDIKLMFTQTCQRGNLKKVKRVWSLFPKLWDRNLKYNYSPLDISCEEGHLKIVKFLVEKCNANIEEKNLDGHTPLHTSCKYDHLKIVKYLVEECNANIKAKNKDGRTPLHISCEDDHLKIVKYLVEECNADVFAKDVWNETALDRTLHIELSIYLDKVMQTRRELTFALCLTNSKFGKRLGSSFRKYLLKQITGYSVIRKSFEKKSRTYLFNPWN